MGIATPRSVQEWRNEFKVIHGETKDLVHSRYMSRRVIQMIRRNPDLPKRSVAYDWFLRGYVHSACAAVRRQVDERKDTISLLRLLNKIAQSPSEITREWFSSRYPDALQQSAGIKFSRFTTNGNTVDRKIVLKDREGLVTKAGPIKAFTDERVAHHAATRMSRTTFPELDDAIDVIEHLVKWYGILLFSSLPLEIKPEVNPEEWRVFQVSWIRGADTEK